jgi:hypothetical protein
LINFSSILVPAIIAFYAVCGIGFFFLYYQVVKDDQERRIKMLHKDDPAWEVVNKKK